MDEKLYSVKVLMDISISPYRDYETVLEAVARKIPSEGISYINFDPEYGVYELYLERIIDIIKLLRDGIEICGIKIPVCPSYDAFLVSGVYPYIENSTLRELFSKFGNVSRISDIRVSPNIAKFSHIKSGFRQVELLIPGREENVCVPSVITAVIEGFSVLFAIRKLCYICMNLGHDTVKCPGLRTGNLTGIKYSLLANNEIVSYDGFNFVPKNYVDEERMTLINDEKSGSDIKKPDEGYKYLSVQSSDNEHYGKESCDNNDKFKNLNTSRGKKRKHSSSSPLANDQNSSEESIVTYPNIRNEMVNTTVSLYLDNCLTPSVSDDSGGQFKKLYSANFCARCKEELEFVGNNHPRDSFAEITNNEGVSENVLSEIHLKCSELEAQGEIVNVIPYSVDDTYAGKEENFHKTIDESKIIDVRSIQEDHLSLPESTNELKSVDVLGIKKDHESIHENIDEMKSADVLSREEIKEIIFNFSSSRNIQNSSSIINATACECINEIADSPVVENVEDLNTMLSCVNANHKSGNPNSNVILTTSHSVVDEMEDHGCFPENTELEGTNRLDIGQSKEEISIQSSNVTDARPSECVNEATDFSAVINPTNDISFSKPHSVDHVYNTKVPGICYGDQLNNIDHIGNSHQMQLSDNKSKDSLPSKNINELSRYDSDQSSTCSSSSLPSIEEILSALERK